MTREELLELVKGNYAKLASPIPNRSDFKVGLYYPLEQTGGNELETYGDRVLYLTFEEGYRYFE